MSRFRILPKSVQNVPLEDIPIEEKEFLFWLEAYWGKHSDSILAVKVIEQQINDVIEEKLDEFMPGGVSKVMQQQINMAPNEEEKKRIKDIMQRGPRVAQLHKIDNLLDVLEEYIQTDKLAEYRQQIMNKVRDKYGADAVSDYMKQKKDSEKERMRQEAMKDTMGGIPGA